MADIDVNLRTYNEETEINDRLLPRTKAENVIESEEKQFISAGLKAKIDQKQDKLGYVPVNKAGDIMTGALILLSTVFNNDSQAVSKKYVDDKIKQIVNSSPEVLDTLYELAAAINNDPNFAVTITNLLSLKLNKDEAVTSATPNKLLYLDGEGNLPADITGNAATASKLKDSFNLNLTGQIETSVKIDGSEDVSIPINLPFASSTSYGLITSEDYLKIQGMDTEIKDQIGSFSVEIFSSDFVNNNGIYKNNIIIDTVRPLAFTKTYEVNDSGSYFEILTQIEVVPYSTNQTITISSLKPFNGKLIYNLLT